MRWFLIIALLLPSFKIRAQESLKGNYILYSLGGLNASQTDYFHSPIPYRGYGLNAMLGWHSFEGNWMSNLDLGGGAGLSNPYQFGDNRNSSLDLSARLHYSLRYLAFKSGKHQVFGGLYSQNFFNYRQLQNFANSSESFAAFFGVGPSVAYTYTRRDRIFGKDFNWSYQAELNIPASTIYLRPSFTRQLVAGTPGFVDHQLWGDAWQMDFRHSFIWHRANGNQIRLSYHWEYLKASRPNPYYFAQHQINLQLFFKL